MSNKQIKEKQHGAALVVGIVLLMVATLLALVAANNTLFQERMASNQHNKTISLMAAEFGAGEFLSEITEKGYDPNSNATQWVVGTAAAPQVAGSQGGYFWAEILSHEDNSQSVPVPLRVAVHGVSRTEPQQPDLARSELHLTVGITTVPPEGGASSDAALNLVGQLGEFGAANSNVFKVFGAQEEGQPTGPAVGVSNPDDKIVLEDALGEDGVDRLGNYEGGIAALDYGDFWTNPETLRQFVDLVCAEPQSRCGTSVADNTTGRGNNREAAMIPKITVVRGNAEVDFGGGSVGAGLLIVEGDVYMNGNPSWDGIIISLGGTISVSGAGNGEFNGTLYSLNIDTSNSNQWTHNTGCAREKPRRNQAPKCRTDEDGNPIYGLVWETGGGGTADYRHDCNMIEMALGLLDDPALDETTDPPTPLNARALFGDNHGCGPAGESSGGGGTSETRYRISWVEVLN